MPTLAPAAIVPAPSSGLGGSSNYILNSNCTFLTGLVVSVNITEDLVTSNGFNFQLNAHSPGGYATATQQYCLAVDPAGRVQLLINSYSGPNVQILLQWDDICHLHTSTLPAGSNLSIALSYDANSNVTGATFTMGNYLPPAPGSALNAYSGTDNSQHVNFIGTDGHVHETYLNPATGFWMNNDLTYLSGNGVAPVNGSPLAGYWGGDNSQHVHFVGTDGHVHELYIYPGGGWADNDLTVSSGGGVLPVPGGSLHSYWGDLSSQHVNFLGTDGHVHELYIMPGIGWRTNDLTVASGSTVVPRIGTALGGFAGSESSQHVHYIGADGHIHEIYANEGAGWANNDLTIASGVGVTATINSPLFSYYGPQGSQHINFIGTDNHVHEIYANAGAGWATNDLTLVAGSTVLPRADSPIHAYPGTDNSQHVNYLGTDDHVHELYIHPGASWSDNDITAFARDGVTPLSGSPIDGYWNSDTSQHINFIGIDGAIHELFIYPGGGWGANNLTQAQINRVSQTDLTIAGATASDLAPITSFQLDLVGHDSYQTTVLSSGAGTITYSASVPLTPLTTFPTCTQAAWYTGEKSNSSYGELSDTASNNITQSFSTGLTVMELPKGITGHATPAPPK